MRTACLLAALALAGGRGVSAPRPAATVTIQPGTRYQTILGWGASSAHMDIPDRLRDEILDEAVGDLGLTRLRLEAPSGNRSSLVGWEQENDNGDPDDINWAAFSTGPFDAKVSQWVVPFKERVEANGDPFTIYISPSLFNGGSSGQAPAWLIASPGEYAEFALALILRLKNKHGITATYYSVCNEAGNGNLFSPQVAIRAIKTLGPKLQALGLPTKIEFPECVNAGVSWRYIQAAKDDPDFWKLVGLITYHLYGSRAERPLIRDFALAKGIPTGQTEFMGTTINDLYDDLTEGGCSVWEHYVMAGWGNVTHNGSYMSANFNQTSFSRYSRYWDFRQVMHYVRPGAVRVEAASDDAGLRPLAFVRDGKTTLVLLNNAAPQQDRSVTVKGLPDGQYGVCQSVASRPFQEMGIKAAADGALTLDVPRNTVLTVYPYGGKNLPPTFTDWRAAPSFLEVPKSETTLSAAATDPERDPLAFAWTLESKPAGADVTLDAPEAAKTQAKGLTKPGSYLFAVAASDPTHTVVRKVELTVFAGNQPPVIVDLHNRIPVDVTLPQSETLLRGGARDLEGDRLTFRWSIASQPQGAQAGLGEQDKRGWVLSNLTVPGDYVVKLEASDPTHTVSESLKVTVHPAGRPPVVESVAAVPARLTLPASKVTLSAKTSDPDGDVLTHWWEVQSAPPGSRPVIEKQGSPTTAATGLTVAGTYVFALTVVDRTHVVRKTVTVPVIAQEPER